MSQAKGSWMRMAVVTGALANQFRRGSTNRTTTNRLATGGERGADGRQRVMLTVFLRHNQSRPLSELNAQLQRQGLL